MAESNDSLPPGFGHLHADCRALGSAVEPYAHFKPFTQISLGCLWPQTEVYDNIV